MIIFYIFLISKQEFYILHRLPKYNFIPQLYLKVYIPEREDKKNCENWNYLMEYNRNNVCVCVCVCMCVEGSKGNNIRANSFLKKIFNYLKIKKLNQVANYSRTLKCGIFLLTT